MITLFFFLTPAQLKANLSTCRSTFPCCNGKETSPRILFPSRTFFTMHYSSFIDTCTWIMSASVPPPLPPLYTFPNILMVTGAQRRGDQDLPGYAIHRTSQCVSPRSHRLYQKHTDWRTFFFSVSFACWTYICRVLFAASARRDKTLNRYRIV